MSRSSSIADHAAAGRYHFKTAVDILEHQPPPIRRAFPSHARDIEGLARRLTDLLREGTLHGAKLADIDRCTTELMDRCIEVQQVTLRARRDGGK